MLTKGDVKIGVATRFGPKWPGKRCGAKTKSGTPCQRPAVSRTGRCYRHGGKSTGPRTEEGRSRIAALHTKHGRYTKEKREAARASAEVGRSIRAELRQIEKTLIRSGLLEPGWRDAFESGASGNGTLHSAPLCFDCRRQRTPDASDGATQPTGSNP
jgi:hypothetical protein